MSNGIIERQNAEKNLTKLAAQRKRYSDGKILMTLQIFLSIVVVLILAGLSLIFIDYRPLILAVMPYYGFSIVIVNLAIIDKIISKIKVEAATIQEDYDCNILGLPWNNIKADWPEYAEIKGHADNIVKSKDDYKNLKLTNWYFNPDEEEEDVECHFDDLPLTIARLICQKYNSWWDHSLGKGFVILISIITGIFIVLLLAYLLYSGIDTSQFCSSFLFPALPAIVITIRYIQDHRKSNRILDRIEKQAEIIWNEILSSKSFNMDIVSRQLQDEIFESRKTRELIPDWYYNHLRILYENKGYYSIQQMVKDYCDRLK